MKWKRSKKAQQEAKEKKSSSNASTSSTSSSSSSSQTSVSTATTGSNTVSNANLVSKQSINGPISEHIPTNKPSEKILDANLLLLTQHTNTVAQHSNQQHSIHQSKQMPNLDQHHRHIVNLSEYNSNLSIEESMQTAAKLNRRPMIFGDGSQDMFRPYVV